jgi:membrane protein
MDRLRTWFVDQFRSLYRAVKRVTSRFGRDACAGRAAGLAFSTLFALVPLIAVVVAVLSLFGVFEPAIADARRAVLEELVPAASTPIVDSLAEFSENARALGSFGIGLYLVTAIALIKAIHTSLNAIWRFRSNSGFWRKVSTYTTIIVFGTGLLAAAVLVGPSVQSIIGQEAASVPWLQSFSELILPIVLLFITLFLTIILVPSGKVNPGSAAVGALTATLAWEVAKRIFVFWTGSVMRLNVIYGSLAAVPLFLIWLYLTWLIILAGVEVAYVHQHRREPTDESGSDEPTAPLAELSEYTAAALMELFRRFRDGADPLTQQELDVRYGARTAEAVRDGLLGTGLALESTRGFVPSRDLSRISIDDVVRGLWSNAGTDGDTRDPPAAELLSTWQTQPDRCILHAITLDTQSHTES